MALNSFNTAQLPHVREHAVSGWARAGAAGLGGALTNLAWLDGRMFVAAWLGMTLLIFATIGEPPHRAFRYWLLGGLVGVGMAYCWLPSMASRHLGVSRVSGLEVALLVVTWDAFRYAVSGYFVAMIRQRGIHCALVWPVIWVALEWIWPHVIPWRLGHTQIGWLSFCQIAEVTGVYGVSFLLLWGAACSAKLLRSWMLRSSGQALRAAIRQAGLCGLVLLVALVWGGWRMDDIEQIAAACPQLRVALVQPGECDDSLAFLQESSGHIAGEVDLIVWGESSVGSFSTELDSFSSPDEVRAHARFAEGDERPCPGANCPLLCGGESFAPSHRHTGPFRNTAFLIDTDEAVLGRYHKRVLMPWGEYAVGQQWLPGLLDLLGDRNRVVAGDCAAPLQLPDQTRLGVLICYEDVSSQAVRDTVREGAQVLVNLNNLTVFGDTSALAQHQHIAQFRAIENRRSLVRCGMTGMTAAIAASGRVELVARPLASETLIHNVPLIDLQSVYTRRGDALPVVSLTLSVLMFAWQKRSGFRRRLDHNVDV